MLIYGSFKGGGPGTLAGFTFQGYVSAFNTSSTYEVLWTTLWLGLVRTILSVALGVFLAWVVTRTDTPGRKTLEVLVWLVFLGLPLLPTTVAWTILASKTGFLNQAIMAILPLQKPPFDIYSYGGIIWVSVTFWAAIVFILVTPAFRGMDAALEESSRVLGANNITTLRRITVPLLTPAILGATILTFIRFLESFETELLLGYGKGIYVYTTRIWWLLGITPSDFPQAMAFSSVFLVLIFGLVFLQWKLTGNKQYVTVTGRGFATRPTPLGAWKYTTLGLVLLYFVVTFVAPFCTLALGSFMKIWGVWQAEPFTMQHWKSTFDDPRFFLSLKNTILVGFGAASLGMLLYSIASYIVVRTKLAGRKLIDFIAWLPWGVPSLVLALGFLWAYVGGLPFLSLLFGTIWLLMIVFIVRGLPLGVRIMNGAMYQLGKELEESSRVLGASWLYTFRRVVAPLVSPAFISAWIILFLIAVRDVVTVVFLYTPSSRLISVALLEHWLAGEYERATVIGMIMTLILVFSALLARFLGTRQEVPL